MQRFHPSIKEEKISHPQYYPVVLHFYSTKNFGHIALQLGEFYLSFGVYQDVVKDPTRKKDNPIESEIKEYGKHYSVALPVSHAQIKKVKEKWEQKWQHSQYNILTNNCVHAILEFLIEIGVLPKTANARRPYELFCLVIDAQFERIGSERQALLNNKEISPLVKIEQLLQNDIDRLKVKFQKEQASYFSFDLKKIQDKIRLLMKLKRDIKGKNVDEIIYLLKSSADSTDSLTQQNLLECYDFVCSLKGAENFVTHYESWLAQLSIVTKAKSRCLEEYTAVRNKLIGLSFRTLIQPKLDQVHQENMSRADQGEEVLFNHYKNLLEVTDLAMRLDSIKGGTREELAVAKLDLIEAIKLKPTIVSDIECLKDSIKSLDASLTSPEDNKRVKLSHIEWIIFQLENMIFKLEQCGNRQYLLKLNQLLLECQDKMAQCDKVSADDMLTYLLIKIAEVETIFSSASPIRKQLSTLREKFSDSFSIEEKEDDVACKEFNSLAMAISNLKFTHSRLNSYLTNYGKKMAEFISAGVITPAQALQEIHSEMTALKHLEIPSYLGKRVLVFAADSENLVIKAPINQRELQR